MNVQLQRVKFWREKCRVNNQLHRKLLCEFVATAFLIYVGTSVDAQTKLAGCSSYCSTSKCIGWGLALLFSVQMVMPVNGAHLNPAVSFFCWSFGEMSFAHFLLYSAAQTVGAFVGATLTFLHYFDKIAEFDGGVRAVHGPRETASIFATYPDAHLSVLGAIIDQITCTAILCLIIGIITDKRQAIPRVAQPTMMGGMLCLIDMAFGLNTGNAMNPARDLGPRVFTWLAGYGWEVFSYNNYAWTWIPTVCPFFGAFLGAWIYKFVISAQLEEEKHEEKEKLSEDITVDTTNSTTVLKLIK